MNRDFKLLEHTLIPLALLALNILTGHLIYLIFARTFSCLHILLALFTTALLVGIYKKNKYLIAASLIIYTTVLFFELC